LNLQEVMRGNLVNNIQLCARVKNKAKLQEILNDLEKDENLRFISSKCKLSDKYLTFNVEGSLNPDKETKWFRSNKDVVGDIKDYPVCAALEFRKNFRELSNMSPRERTMYNKASSQFTGIVLRGHELEAELIIKMKEDKANSSLQRIINIFNE